MDGGIFSKTKYCFELNDQTIVATFSASSESDRDEWVDVIREAIAGVRHPRPDDTNEDNETAVKHVSRRVSAVSLGLTHITPELPRKVGELDKKPIVGRFGIKSPKKRYSSLSPSTPC